MRQDRNSLRLTLVAAACGLVLSACGGGGDPGASGRLQLITFPYVGADATLGVKTVTLKASSTSGLPVSFASATPDVCTVAGDQLTVLKGGGECSVIASQPGGTDANGVAWAAADNISQLFVVTKTAQEVSFTPPGYVLSTTSTQVPLSATSSSGLPVSFTASPASVCSIQGSTLNLLGKGSCTVEAAQAGDGNYLPGATTRFIAVDPLIVADGFEAGGGKGSTNAMRTKQGGGVSSNPWDSSNGGWQWCNASAGDWCYQEVAADGSSMTSALRTKENPGWHTGFNQVDIFTPGVTGLASGANTAGGVKVTTETMLGFTLGLNKEFASLGKPIVVQLVLSKNGGGSCNVTLSTAVFSPSTNAMVGYGVPLSNFAVTDACGLSGVTTASLDSDIRKLPNYLGKDAAETAANTAKFIAALAKLQGSTTSATTLLQTYPIVQVRLRALDTNDSTLTPDKTIGGKKYSATDLTVGGLISIQ